jgi:hypothetical protein
MIGGLAAMGLGRAAPVNALFFVNESTSELMVEIEARGFSDTDAQPLGGAISAILDFGTSGSFPQQAAVTVTTADIAATGDFEFRLGLPSPFPGADVVASGIVADVTTPTPPATLTRLPGPSVSYQFDAAQFLITANHGTIVVTGFVEGEADLEEEPVSGMSPPGTLGTLTLTPGATTGFYTLVSAQLVLPVNITDVAEFGEEDPEEVMLDLDATVNATAAFYVALAGAPGDFDGDADVDGADLPLWRAGFGMSTGAEASDGDADADGDADGNDFLVWQRNLGTMPPVIAGGTVPEPRAGVGLLTGVLLGGGLYRNRARRR